MIVWQKSHEMVIEVYKITNAFPESERFGLTQQVKRSVVSIAANIVEGKSRKTDKEFTAFLYTSRGSLEETRYHLLLAKDLGFISETQYDSFENKAKEVSYLLNRLITSINK